MTHLWTCQGTKISGYFCLWTVKSPHPPSISSSVTTECNLFLLTTFKRLSRTPLLRHELDTERERENRERWQAAGEAELGASCLTHLVCYVVHHDGCLGTSVVHGGQTVVALLAGRVPDFKLDRRVVQAHRLSQEGSCRQTQESSHNHSVMLQINTAVLHMCAHTHTVNYVRQKIFSCCLLCWASGTTGLLNQDNPVHL